MADPDITLSHVTDLYGPFVTSPQRPTGIDFLTGPEGWVRPVPDQGGTRWENESAW